MAKPIETWLLGDSIIIERASDGSTQEFDKVRCRTTNAGYQTTYGLENNASWQIWFDKVNTPLFSIAKDWVQVGNVVTFTDDLDIIRAVTIVSVDYRKTKMNEIHHIKVVCS